MSTKRDFFHIRSCDVLSIFNRNSHHFLGIGKISLNVKFSPKKINL